MSRTLSKRDLGLWRHLARALDPSYRAGLKSVIKNIGEPKYLPRWGFVHFMLYRLNHILAAVPTGNYWDGMGWD